MKLIRLPVFSTSVCDSDDVNRCKKKIQTILYFVLKKKQTKKITQKVDIAAKQRHDLVS